MLRSVKSHQRKVRQLEFKVDGTGTPSITYGSQHATLTDNGTGDYTLTFTNPGQRELFAIACSTTTEVWANLVSFSKSAVRFLFNDDDGAPTDVDFYALVILSDSADEY